VLDVDYVANLLSNTISQTAGPQRVFAFPQDVVSQASKASPEMSNYPVTRTLT